MKQLCLYYYVNYNHYSIITEQSTKILRFTSGKALLTKFVALATCLLQQEQEEHDEFSHGWQGDHVVDLQHVQGSCLGRRHDRDSHVVNGEGRIILLCEQKRRDHMVQCAHLAKPCLGCVHYSVLCC